MQQYDDLSSHFTQRAAYKEKTLTQRGLTVQAGEHSEQIFTRWRAGTMTAGRWLGAAISRWRSCAGGHLVMPVALANDDVAEMLKDNLRSMASNYLAQGINASPPRHFIISG
jgi:hypothetical protein